MELRPSGPWRRRTQGNESSRPELDPTRSRPPGRGSGLADPCAEPGGAPALRVVLQGEAVELDEPVELTLEDGSTARVADRLSGALPPGYHQYRSLDREEVTKLIVSPGRCYLPPGLRTWGWSVQLYALRSQRSWGMGDLADLRRFARWSTRQTGAGLVEINPLSAVAPNRPQEKSPYFPSSRRYRNPLYICVEEAPGAAAVGSELEKIAAAGRALNRRRLIDRDAIFEIKMRALRRLWRKFHPTPEFRRYCVEEGAALEQFAAFCVLAERHGADWRRWPPSLRRPDSPSTRQALAADRGRFEFHKWLQWLLDDQFKQAATEAALLNDLPIGIDPGGADAWVWQDLLARERSIGAPPDLFNGLGQDWGLAAFDPDRLRVAGYEPFRETVRAAMRHASGLRVDHVMGLFRLYLIPRGADPRMGTYLRFRSDELLAILALESQRARVVIIGEDLGSVPPGVRTSLRRRDILGYRLLLTETRSPREYSRRSLATITTHDLPTMAGLWSGQDLAAQRRAGLSPNSAGLTKWLKRLRRRIGLPPGAPARRAILRACRLLAGGATALMSVTMEDALGLKERVNLPGDRGQKNANWSRALPIPLEKLEVSYLPRALAAAIRRARGASIVPKKQRPR